MLPPPVAAMLEGYRARQAERPNDWGDELPGLARGQAYARWLGARLVEVVFTGQDWPAAVRGCLTDPLPAGLIVASLDGGGIRLRAGPRPYAVPAAPSRWRCCSTPTSTGRPGSRSTGSRGRWRPAASSWSP